MRILIIKTSALGDIVHALPTLTALRRALPEAVIGWVVEDVFESLLAGHPDLDAVVPVRTRAWRRMNPVSSLREITAFIRALQGFGADIALDLMGNHKAGAIAALSLADRRIGLHASQRRERTSALWINESTIPRGRHAVEVNLAVLQALGIPAQAIDFGPEKLFRDAVVPDLPTDFILIHPGAGWGNKRYPAAAWGRVAALIAARMDLPVLVASGHGEEALAERVARDSEDAAQVARLPTLPMLAAALRRARLTLAADTGPLHLAHALGTPALAIMGPTDPARHGPYGALDRAVVHHLPCSFCYQRFNEVKACLINIAPEEIADRALQLLG
jgi:heptosyltransferase-1